MRKLSVRSTQEEQMDAADLPPDAYSAPLPEDVPVIDGPPPEGAVMEGPVEGARNDLVDQLLDDVLGN